MDTSYAKGEEGVTQVETESVRRPSIAVTRSWLKNQVVAPRMLALYDQMLVSGVNFVTLVYLGRQLESERFGVFTLAYMTIFGLGSLHTALIVQPFNLLGATRPAEINLGHLRALVRVHVFAWLPMNLALFAVVAWQFFPEPMVFLSAAVYLCMFQLQELLRRYRYICGEINRALAIDFICYGIQIPIIALWSLQPGFDVTSVFLAMSCTSALALACALYGLRNQPAMPMSAREVVGAHWKEGGAWLLLGTVSAYGALQLYPYMLADLGPGAVATFAAAWNLLNALNVLVQAENNYLPISSKRILDNNGIDALPSYLRRVGAGMFLIAGLFCIVISYESSGLLHWIYGKSFEEHGDPLPLLALRAICIVLYPVVNAGLLVLRQTHVIFVSNVVATVFCVTVGWWLIRHYGVNGAAIATSLGALLVLVIQTWRLSAAFGNPATRRFLGSRPCIS